MALTGSFRNSVEGRPPSEAMQGLRERIGFQRGYALTGRL
jgi:hypothetical protein